MRVFLVFFLMSLNLAAAEPVQGIAVSGVVRDIRGGNITEVFFKDPKDFKDSLVIPRNSKHNEIYKVCDDSKIHGTPVHLMIDPKNRQILGLPEPPKNPADDKEGLGKTPTDTAQ
jgi:hypothetical protein